jgi:aspartate aminotransferase-like enzyme
VTAEAVQAALASLPKVDLVAIVHAETSSGILNPLPAIAAAVKARGALLVVDAVASAGGHVLDIDGWGIDLCVIGPQKALGGPAALSVVAVSPRAWAAMNPPAAWPSNLSLADIKRHWLDAGRGQPMGMPSALEFWALDAALDRVAAETLPKLIARHELAGRASRAALVALGVPPWVADEALASTLATAAPIPPGIDPAALIAAAREFGVTLTPGFGEVRDRLVRLDHAGPRANFSPVLANVTAYGQALQRLGVKVDVGAAAAAAAKAYT